MEYIYETIAAQNKSIFKAQYTLDKALTEASRDGYEPFGEMRTFKEPAPKGSETDKIYILMQRLRRPAQAEPQQPTPKEMLDTYIEQTNKLAQLGAEIVEALRDDK